VANILSLTPSANGTAQTYSLVFHNPELAMMLFLIAIFLGFISFWGIIAAVFLFFRRKGARVASILWHGLMLLPLILLVVATFSGDYIPSKILSSAGASMSLFSLMYLNKPSTKQYFFNHYQK
jgi:hypothetical protein